MAKINQNFLAHRGPFRLRSAFISMRVVLKLEPHPQTARDSPGPMWSILSERDIPPVWFAKPTGKCVPGSESMFRLPAEAGEQH
jgi:hypothetical protein